MLTSLTFTILQTGMCNFEFYCHYPPWYLRHTHNNKKICAPLRQSGKKWTICLDYPEFKLGIELRLVKAAAASILRLNRVPPAVYELGLILSCGWLEFQRLDKSCGWLYPAADSRFGCWIRIAADSILRLTRISAAGYDLRMILSYGWLEFRRLDKSCRCTRVTADSILRLATDCAYSILRLTQDLPAVFD